MKIKKLLAAICAAGLLMTGCGGEQSGSETKDPNSQATIIKLGMISHLNAGEKQMEEYLFKVQEKTRAKVTNHVPVFYDSLSLMQMGIESGNVDRISTYKSVAHYIVRNNDRFEIVNDDWIKGLTDNFCFAVKKEDAALKTDLDKAINEIKSDGTLDKLIRENITDVANGKTPPKVEIPKVDGADTIKIGVTGDLPPLDLILPDNTPVGFNTALLAEIAKRLNKNVELIQISSGARAAALNADQIDVIFWVVVPEGGNLPADIDKPDGIELSEPYFRDEIAHLKLKN
ncbi:MAG: transporter substrate-binding domain-containing protein [Selenomonadaceae bacterium]|nr:transporter substrate-binding domain-containing protein [Selenomonadaceae bacterium]